MPQFQSRRFALLAGALILLLDMAVGASPASADLKLCNTTASRVGVAIGYKQNDKWIAEGWWNIVSNACETIFRGDLKARFYYVHARDYDRGGEWAGKAFMCTTEKAFTIEGVQDCQTRGYRQSGFFEIDTHDAKDWSIRLADPSEPLLEPIAPVEDPADGEKVQ